ncbi:MAG: sulfite exporter TauE/SafE family protein [Hyphomicrobiaceae bacterium]
MLPPELGWMLVLLLGVLAGTVGGVVGFGSAIILMPALVLVFGAKAAVPIVAIASIMANLSRAAVWWREIDWRANAAYCATAIPAAALGANLLVKLDARAVEGALGLALLAMVPARRWLLAHGLKIGIAHLAVVGAAIGLLTGLVATTGPINTPFFLAYGLTKGAFLATEAIGSAAIAVTKVVVFRSLSALPLETAVNGLVVGASLMVGSWLAKGLVQRLDASQFRVLLEVLSMAAGALMLWSAVTG